MIEWIHIKTWNEFLSVASEIKLVNGTDFIRFDRDCREKIKGIRARKGWDKPTLRMVKAKVSRSLDLSIVNSNDLLRLELSRFRI